MSLVACTPVGSGHPESSAASTPNLSAPCAHTLTNSMSGRPMMACSDRRPMFPVVHWITRNGRSGLVVVMGLLCRMRVDSLCELWLRAVTRRTGHREHSDACVRGGTSRADTGRDVQQVLRIVTVVDA